MESVVKEILADIFDIDADDVGENFTPESVELWDSLNHLRMVTAIEDRFRVTFTMEEIGQMTSYDVIVKTVRNHVQQR